MKYKHQCECMDKNCRTVIVGTDNRLDGISCPRCGGPVFVKPYESMKDKKESPLLKIELDDINSVPTVYYKGKVIKWKVRVSFDWETQREGGPIPTYIHLEHADMISNGINTMTIQHNQPLSNEDK